MHSSQHRSGTNLFTAYATVQNTSFQSYSPSHSVKADAQVEQAAAAAVAAVDAAAPAPPTPTKVATDESTRLHLYQVRVTAWECLWMSRHENVCGYHGLSGVVTCR